MKIKHVNIYEQNYDGKIIVKERYEEPQLQIKTNKRLENENEQMNSIHYYNSWFFFTRLFSQKILKNDMCQKITLSIWTSRFGHVQRD